MRPLLLLFALFSLPLLAACTEAAASRVDEKTFRIESPEMAGDADAVNRRLAYKICPKGFRIVDSVTQRGGMDRAAGGFNSDNDPVTIWQIRCI